MGGFLSGVASAFAHPIRSAQQASMGIGHGLYAANHWLAPHGYGAFSPHGLRVAGEQTLNQGAHMFDPRSRAGALNLASMFVGGPEGDSFGGQGMSGEEMLGKWQPGGKFEPYKDAVVQGHVPAHATGHQFEGPIRPGKNYNPSIQKMVEGVRHNPFVRAAKDVTSREQQNALEKQSALDIARTDAARAMQARRQVDEHLGSAPMQAQRPWEGDVSGSHLHGPSVLNHPNFIKAMLQRRYQAGLGHNHLN